MPVSDTTFITADDFKYYVPQDFNIDTQWLYSAIRYEQRNWIKQILGRKLYAELQQQVFDETLTMENAALLDEYVKRPLAILAAAKALRSLHYKITASGVVVNKPQNSEPASMADIRGIQNELENEAQLYLQEMIDFLRDNKTDYPLFAESDYCKDYSKQPFRRGQLWLGHKPKNKTVWNDHRSSTI